MAEISTIEIDGTEVELADAKAREALAALPPVEVVAELPESPAEGTVYLVVGEG